VTSAHRVQRASCHDCGGIKPGVDMRAEACPSDVERRNDAGATRIRLQREPPTRARSSFPRAETLTGTAVALAGIALASPCAAYRTNADDLGLPLGARVVWSADQIVVEVNDNGVGALAGSATSVRASDAAGQWNGVSCNAASLAVAPSQGPATPGDSRNTVEWVLSGWQARGQDPNSPGYTDLQLVQTGAGQWQIAEADVYLNAEQVSTNASQAYWRTVLLHEFGHVLGLVHPCERTATDSVPACASSTQFGPVVMNPVYSVQRTALSADDQAGVCFLYPSVSSCGGDCAASEGLGQGQRCASDPDCAMPLKCSNGLCAPGAIPLGLACQNSRQCQSGVCAGYCAPRCASAADCASGEACIFVDGPRAACVGKRGAVGATCSETSDCLTSLCLTEQGRVSVCTSGCATSADCSSGWTCETVHVADAGERVCAPPFKSSSSCSYSVVRDESFNSWWYWPAIGLWILRGRRRRSKTTSWSKP
jgi:hypothetical protein